MPERAALFDDEERTARPSPEIDLSGFAPKKPAVLAPQAEAVRAVSEKASFRSREPVQAKSPNKADRRHRTGRNKQLNTKVTERTEQLLYEIYDAHREREHWTLGEIIGLALETFKRDLDAKRNHP